MLVTHLDPTVDIMSLTRSAAVSPDEIAMTSSWLVSSLCPFFVLRHAHQSEISTEEEDGHELPQFEFHPILTINPANPDPANDLLSFEVHVREFVQILHYLSRAKIRLRQAKHFEVRMRLLGRFQVRSSNQYSEHPFTIVASPAIPQGRSETEHDQRQYQLFRSGGAFTRAELYASLHEPFLAGAGAAYEVGVLGQDDQIPADQDDGAPTDQDDDAPLDSEAQIPGDATSATSVSTPKHSCSMSLVSWPDSQSSSSDSASGDSDSAYVTPSGCSTSSSDGSDSSHASSESFASCASSVASSDSFNTCSSCASCVGSATSSEVAGGSPVHLSTAAEDASTDDDDARGSATADHPDVAEDQDDPSNIDDPNEQASKPCDEECITSGSLISSGLSQLAALIQPENHSDDNDTKDGKPSEITDDDHNTPAVHLALPLESPTIADETSDNGSDYTQGSWELVQPGDRNSPQTHSQDFVGGDNEISGQGEQVESQEVTAGKRSAQATISGVEDVDAFSAAAVDTLRDEELVDQHRSTTNRTQHSGVLLPRINGIRIRLASGAPLTNDNISAHFPRRISPHRHFSQSWRPDTQEHMGLSSIDDDDIIETTRDRDLDRGHGRPRIPRHPNSVHPSLSLNEDLKIGDDARSYNRRQRRQNSSDSVPATEALFNHVPTPTSRGWQIPTRTRIPALRSNFPPSSESDSDSPGESDSPGDSDSPSDSDYSSDSDRTQRASSPRPPAALAGFHWDLTPPPLSEPFLAHSVPASHLTDNRASAGSQRAERGHSNWNQSNATDNGSSGSGSPQEASHRPTRKTLDKVPEWLGIESWDEFDRKKREFLAKRSTAKKEAARKEAAKKEVTRRETARTGAETEEAATQETAARKEAARKETARLETARREFDDEALLALAMAQGEAVRRTMPRWKKYYGGAGSSGSHGGGERAYPSLVPSIGERWKQRRGQSAISTPEEVRTPADVEEYAHFLDHVDNRRETYIERGYFVPAPEDRHRGARVPGHEGEPVPEAGDDIPYGDCAHSRRFRGL